MTRLAADRLVQAGFELIPLLKEAGIPDDILSEPDTRVSVRSQIDFLRLAAEALGDDLLGFHLAKDTDLREAGPIFHVMASSETVADGFDCAVRFCSILNEGVQLHRGPNAFTMEFEYVGVRRLLDRHQMEFWVTAGLRLIRLFTGREIIPLSVGFLHQRDGDVSEMERYFGCAVEFGAPRDTLSFDAQDGKLRLLSADRYLNKFLVEYYEETILRRRSMRQSIRNRVENAITPRLPHGTMSINNIASDLGMSVRTLSRRLSDEGLTFSSILEDLRSDLANRYLQNNSLSISQIAWLLGYSEVSSFAHAFQRWTGNSPTSARKQMGEGSFPQGAAPTKIDVKQ
ncbi:AraC family transcriptional regulator [Microvirga lotononidis]|uniref:AraC family transcriptional regulator n=1 Tax=Microvirga lotononidis TaxID=864069 RepID=UPI00058C02A1|nr:AraC family transcriptional regulator [Microvirga lotononidis]WQO26851.1 AraC family transcriptional regulator [Microvirga lotononidis]